MSEDSLLKTSIFHKVAEQFFHKELRQMFSVSKKIL